MTWSYIYILRFVNCLIVLKFQAKSIGYFSFAARAKFDRELIRKLQRQRTIKWSIKNIKNFLHSRKQENESKPLK